MPCDRSAHQRCGDQQHRQSRRASHSLAPDKQHGQRDDHPHIGPDPGDRREQQHHQHSQHEDPHVGRLTVSRDGVGASHAATAQHVDPDKDARKGQHARDPRTPGNVEQQTHGGLIDVARHAPRSDEQHVCRLVVEVRRDPDQREGEQQHRSAQRLCQKAPVAVISAKGSHDQQRRELGDHRQREQDGRGPRSIATVEQKATGRQPRHDHVDVALPDVVEQGERHDAQKKDRRRRLEPASPLECDRHDRGGRQHREVQVQPVVAQLVIRQVGKPAVGGQKRRQVDEADRGLPFEADRCPACDLHAGRPVLIAVGVHPQGPVVPGRVVDLQVPVETVSARLVIEVPVLGRQPEAPHSHGDGGESQDEDRDAQSSAAARRSSSFGGLWGPDRRIICRVADSLSAAFDDGLDGAKRTAFSLWVTIGVWPASTGGATAPARRSSAE